MDYAKVKDKLVEWIRNWFENNGNGCNAVLGMSGGKDSTICAALLVEALGKDRVIGVSMPDFGQGLNDADKICEYLGIKYLNMPIGQAVHDIRVEVYHSNKGYVSNQTAQNIPPRIRMTMLYALAQSVNGRVVGTCNASENYVGYFTRYGDGASDIEPLANFTVREVKEIGYSLLLPPKWVDRIPDDGLPNSEPDDDKFKKWGFSYATLDKYIEEGTSGDKKIDEAIEQMHKKTIFKMSLGEQYKKP